MPLFASSFVVSIVYDTASTKFKSIRWPLLVGFTIWVGGLVGEASIQPGHFGTGISTVTVVGVGTAGPLLLIIAGTHLSITPHLIATGSASVVCMRAFGATIFTAIYGATVQSRLQNYIPRYITRAVLPLGFPPTSLGHFISALSSQDTAALGSIPGANPRIIGAGVQALQQAFVDGVRVVFIIAAALGVLACSLCALLPSFKTQMDSRVEAPLEALHGHSKNGEKA